MKKQKLWTRLAAGLGVAVLVLCQNGITPVRAAEGETEIEVNGLSAATNLKWNEKGQALCDNPNSDWVYAYLYVRRNDEDWIPWNGYYIPSGANQYDAYHSMTETGTYTFKVVFIDEKNGYKRISSEVSAGFEYTKPDTKLPEPEVTVTKEGQVTCVLPESNDGTEYGLGSEYGFGYRLYLRNSSGGYNIVGTERGNDTGTFDFSKEMDADKAYYVRVCTLSRDITKYVNSEWSDYIPFNPNATAAIQKEEPKGWEPTTPDEIRRYTACGSEEVKYTADEKNVYPVTVQNSVQGEKCFDSFDAVLGEYVIGKTYNIFPSGEPAYQMDSKARITLNIPESLQADGRTFRMICVTENGRPVVLEDMDSNSETITFETDTYYAFALVYKDAETSK